MTTSLNGLLAPPTIPVTTETLECSCWVPLFGAGKQTRYRYPGMYGQQSMDPITLREAIDDLRTWESVAQALGARGVVQHTLTGAIYRLPAEHELQLRKISDSYDALDTRS